MMKKQNAAVFLCLYLTVVVWIRAQPPASPVERLQPALEALLSADARLEAVKDGFGFLEGLIWVRQEKSGFLLFSDIPANVIDKMTADGRVSVYLDQSGY